MSPYRIKGTSGVLLNQAFPLGESLNLGTGEGCDVQVERDSGEGVLATLSVLDDGAVQLEAAGGDSAPGEVAVNGDPVTRLNLAGGDELRVGRSRFILQAPGLRPERVLTESATRAPRAQWPWWLAAAVVVGGGVAAAWWQGWLTF